MKRRGTIDAVIFDFDMTLVNSCDAIHHCTNLLAKHLGMREVSRSEVLATIGLTIEDSWRTYWGDFKDSWVDFYRSNYRETEQERLMPFPGVPEMLAALRARGIGLGVVSNRRFAKRAVDSVELGDLMDVVVGLEDADRPKPAPDPLLKGFELLGVPPANGIYAGDTDIDMQTAAAAGCLGLGVTTGNFGAGALFEAGAWKVTDNLALLPSLIEECVSADG